MVIGPANARPTLRWNDPLAVEATAAVQRGQADRLGLFLDKHPAASALQAAALGLTDRVEAALEAEPRPGPEQITNAFWAACGGDHQDVATRLLAAGADINWPGWNNQTPLDAARCADAADLFTWLESHGARPAPAAATTTTTAGNNQPVTTIDRPLPPLNADERTTLEELARLPSRHPGDEVRGPGRQAGRRAVGAAIRVHADRPRPAPGRGRAELVPARAGRPGRPADLRSPGRSEGPDGGFDLAANATLSAALATWQQKSPAPANSAPPAPWPTPAASWARTSACAGSTSI